MRLHCLIALALLMPATVGAGPVCETIKGTSAYAACLNDQIRAQTQALNRKPEDPHKQRATGGDDPLGLYQLPPVYPLTPTQPPLPTYHSGYAASQLAARRRVDQDTALRTQQLSNQIGTSLSAPAYQTPGLNTGIGTGRGY